jgi:hypothetical protein
MERGAYLSRAKVHRAYGYVRSEEYRIIHIRAVRLLPFRPQRTISSKVESCLHLLVLPRVSSEQDRRSLPAHGKV